MSDPQDHLIQVMDAEGNVTDSVYSDRDLLSSESSPASGLTTHTYNARGALTSTTDARLTTTTRTLDDLDRVKQIDYPNDSDIDFRYDAALSDPTRLYPIGRLVEIERTDPNVSVTTEYDYDRFGRLILDDRLTYQYDKNGNVTEIVFPGGIEAHYDYDGSDRQSGLTVSEYMNQIPSGNFTPVTITGGDYYAFGPLRSLSYGNGLTETRGFDSRTFPTGIDLAGASTLLDWNILATDGVGNLLEIDETGDATPERSFAYQPSQYFLTCASGPWNPAGSDCVGGPTGSPLEWTYDRIGNRLTETRRVGTSDKTFSFCHSPDEMSCVGNTPILHRVELPPPFGSDRKFSYDAAGSMTQFEASGNTIDFSVNDAGRIAQLDRQSGNSQAYFFYDGRGFLAHADEQLPTGLILLAGQGDLIFEDDLEATLDLSKWTKCKNGPGCDDDIVSRVTPTYSSDGRLMHLSEADDASNQSEQYVLYLAGRPVLQLTWVDPPVLNLEWRFLTTDHLGTPLMVTDDAAPAQVVWSGGFEPFGRDWQEPLGTASLDAGIFLRLPGQWDHPTWAEASLGFPMYYNVHRWYGYRVGRYTRADPLGLSGGPQLYPYALSNPIFNTDPLGLKTLGLGGVVFNFSDCCVLVSENAPEGGQQQRYVSPRSTSGTVDVDAIYFEDGGALKIPDWSTYIIFDCSSLKSVPTGFLSRPILSNLRIPRYRTKPLPDRKTQEQEFGGPIFQPKPDCPCP